MASGSVTRWITKLREDDSAAQCAIYQHFEEPLRARARRRLRAVALRTLDDDDLVNRALQSFFRRTGEGTFQLPNRGAVWSLLARILDCKLVNEVRRATTKKRGGGRVRGQSGFAADASHAEWPARHDATPASIAVQREQLTAVVARLDDVHRQIFELWIGGLDYQQIARRVNRTVATVERRLRLIRRLCEEALQG